MEHLKTGCRHTLVTLLAFSRQSECLHILSAVSDVSRSFVLITPVVIFQDRLHALGPLPCQSVVSYDISYFIQHSVSWLK